MQATLLRSSRWYLHNKMGGSNNIFREYINDCGPITEKDCLICANEQIVSIILKTNIRLMTVC